MLHLDVDAAILNDFYPYVKAHPEVNVWSLPDYTGDSNMNGGMYYIQNVSPEGPVAWAFLQPLEWV